MAFAQGPVCRLRCRRPAPLPAARQGMECPSRPAAAPPGRRITAALPPPSLGRHFSTTKKLQRKAETIHSGHIPCKVNESGKTGASERTAWTKYNRQKIPPAIWQIIPER